MNVKNWHLWAKPRLASRGCRTFFVLRVLSSVLLYPSLAGATLQCSDLFSPAFAPVQGHSIAVDPRATYLFASIYHDPRVAHQLAIDFEAEKQRTLAERPRALIEDDLRRVKDPNSLLDQTQYMGYVNGIGTENGVGTFQSLSNQVPYLTQTLGISMVYALPFLTSPFRDAGFDVASYKSVDPRFGGDVEFHRFKNNLQANGGRFQLDLVLNHVSAEHPWAKLALAGNQKYRNYFHILETAPIVESVELNKDGKAVSAKYRERSTDGSFHIVERRVIFPDFADPAHPHYFKTVDANGKTIWIYHTFYPFQFDLNYENPAVMHEAFEIVGYWANQGADVVRLDAIPFLFKNRESDPRTLKVVESLRYFLSQVSPRTSIIVEACQEPNVVYQFFGKHQNIPVQNLSVDMPTTSIGQMAYNFDLMTNMWASLLSGDKKFATQGMLAATEPPPGAVWANFLRLHDELTLEMATDEVRKIIRDSLLKTGKGSPFRGDMGVGGRMADFLDRDPRRVNLAFSLLLSLKGMPIIYYGDEIMAGGNKAYAEQAAKDRGGQYDSRDEGRGPTEASAFFSAEQSGRSTPEGTVLADVRRQIFVRKQRASLRRGDTEMIKSDNASVLSYKRGIQGGENTLIVHNLSGRRINARLAVSASGSKLLDLLTEKNVEFKMVDGQIELELEPFQTFWLAN